MAALLFRAPHSCGQECPLSDFYTDLKIVYVDYTGEKRKAAFY